MLEITDRIKLEYEYRTEVDNVTELKEKEFFLIELNGLISDDEHTVKDIRNSILEGLEEGVEYISIYAPDGTNRIEVAGQSTEDIEIDECIECYDEDGKFDMEKTADAVTKEMIVTGMIIYMRDKYDELGDENGTWIDKIMED